MSRLTLANPSSTGLSQVGQVRVTCHGTSFPRPCSLRPVSSRADTGVGSHGDVPARVWGGRRIGEEGDNLVAALGGAVLPEVPAPDVGRRATTSLHDGSLHSPRSSACARDCGSPLSLQSRASSAISFSTENTTEFRGGLGQSPITPVVVASKSGSCDAMHSLGTNSVSSVRARPNVGSQPRSGCRSHVESQLHARTNGANGLPADARRSRPIHTFRHDRFLVAPGSGVARKQIGELNSRDLPSPRCDSGVIAIELVANLDQVSPSVSGGTICE